MRPTDHDPPGPDPLRRRLALAAVAGLGLSAAVLGTAAGHDSPLGAPRSWPWVLTGLQVLALWSAGAGRWWGWPLGGAVQLPWIAYAIATAQLGFVPGCAVSASIQFRSFLRASRVRGAVAGRRPDGRWLSDPAGTRTSPRRRRW